MEGSERGYSIPLSAKKGNFLLYSILATVLMAVLWLFENYETRNKSYHEELMRFVTIFLAAVWLVLMMMIFVHCFSKLHIVPEGLAITLFGMTTRRFPAEQIKLLSGFKETTAKLTPQYLAVCAWSMEDFQEWGKCCQYEEPWEGERVNKYLSRIPSLTRAFHLHKNILLLDWDKERLEILQKMYPNAKWLDCTQKKIFEKQLAE